MAIQIISGATNDIQTIDPLSKAARVTLYGPDGLPLAYPANRERGIADIRVQQTAATAAGSVVWAMRGIDPSAVIYVRKLWLQHYFAGTGAATLMRYELIKGTSCSAMTGTDVDPLRKRTSISDPDVEIKVLNTGMTLTGVVWGAAFFSSTWPRITPSATAASNVASNPFELDFGDQPLELANNEVLALRLVNAAVIGDGVIGGCDFCGG